MNVLITILRSGMNYTISLTVIEVDTACEPWYLASGVGSLQRHQSVHWLLICNDKAQRIFAVQTRLLVMLNDLPSYRGRYSLPTPVAKYIVTAAKTIWLHHFQMQLCCTCSRWSVVPYTSTYAGVWIQVQLGPQYTTFQVGEALGPFTIQDSVVA